MTHTKLTFMIRYIHKYKPWSMERYEWWNKIIRRTKLLELLCVFPSLMILSNRNESNFHQKWEMNRGDLLPIKSKMISHVCFEAHSSFIRFSSFIVIPQCTKWIRTCCSCNLSSIRFTLVYLTTNGSQQFFHIFSFIW